MMAIQIPQRRRWRAVKYLRLAAGALVVCQINSARAEDLVVETIKLPPLRIHDQAAKAHTQGLELAGGRYYVTARREDLRPKQALLLRADPGGADWDIWDITPQDAQGVATALDHPGGLQSDGARLWIPLAESQRQGRSIVRAFRLSEIAAGRRLKSDVEFPVNDHIGAVAVWAERQLLLGANWDTEKVYVWDFQGRLQRTLTGAELKERGFGVVRGPEGRSGVAVQDWKLNGERLFASGLFGAAGSAAAFPASRWICFTDFLERTCQQRTISLPLHNGTELAHEAMAFSQGAIYFLPEDLGASNRLFRVALTDLLQQPGVR